MVPLIRVILFGCEAAKVLTWIKSVVFLPLYSPFSHPASPLLKCSSSLTNTWVQSFRFIFNLFMINWTCNLYKASDQTTTNYFIDTKFVFNSRYSCILCYRFRLNWVSNQWFRSKVPKIHHLYISLHFHYIWWVVWSTCSRGAHVVELL